MASAPRLLERTVGAYLRGQLDSGSATQTKKALQEICKLYRVGYRIRPEQFVGLENSIIGLTFSSSDQKVRRWSLNALAQLGSEDHCKEAILHALEVYHNDADVLAAAIAALYRLSRNAAADLRHFGFNEQMVTLAALQHVAAHRLDLSSLPINVENADSELIKLALVVVGLDKAPSNMFHPNHSNSEIVQAVGRHHDPIVSQYSIWAITENPSLSVDDLGIEIQNIGSLPSNVRGWVFQLLAMDITNIDRHLEYILLGMKDRNSGARLGLAVGLKDSFSEILVIPVLEWFIRETDTDVRQSIIDHMIRQAHRAEAYKEYVIDAFEREGQGSIARDRMLVVAAGSMMHSTLSQIQYNGGSDLLSGVRIVSQNTTYNIGNLQGGAVSLGGDATNSGTSANTYNAETRQLIQSRLQEAEHAVRASVADEGSKKEALRDIEAAQKNPTKDNIVKAVSTMEKVELLAVRTLGAGTALAEIVHLIARAAGLH